MSRTACIAHPLAGRHTVQAAELLVSVYKQNPSTTAAAALTCAVAVWRHQADCAYEELSGWKAAPHQALPKLPVLGHPAWHLS
jgi:hypothetical protein